MPKCPKCGANVSPSDTVCMDCGQDQIAARKDIVQQAINSAPTVAKPTSPAAAVANAAAAGIVLPGEEDAKRLKVFDQQQAKELRKQRPAIVVTVIIALVGAVVLAGLAKGALQQADGMAGVKTLNYGEFKALGFNLTSDPRVMFIALAGLAVAGFLCFVGEVIRLWAMCAAISAVARDEVPNVVGIAIFTVIGLVMAAFFCPPLGLIMGIMFKLSKDPDTSSLGGLMVYASLAAAAIVIMNAIWSLAGEKLKPAPAKGGATTSLSCLRLLA